MPIVYFSPDHDGVYFLLLLSALLAAKNAGKGKILYQFWVRIVQKKVMSFCGAEKPIIVLIGG